jgi:hypothetical protein
MIAWSHVSRPTVCSRVELPFPLSACGKLILPVILLLLGGSSRGAILHVPSVLYPTIQSAINAAAPQGDEVAVADGTYSGSGNAGINLLGKAVIVRSESGEPSACTLDGQSVSGNVVLFAHGETSACVLEGFTITGGAAVFGGGIYIQDSSPTIRNCIVVFNWAGDSMVYSGYGGGIDIQGASSPEISDCDISHNSTAVYHNMPSYGGGIYSQSHTAVLRNCTLTDNHASYGGGFYGNGTLIDCTISSNIAQLELHGGGEGGGVSTQGASLSGCIIAGNVASLSGGGLSGASCMIDGCTVPGNRCGGDPQYWGGGGGLTLGDQTFLTLTIVWGNCSEHYPGDDIDVLGNPTLTCCCVDPGKIDGAVTYDGDQVFQDPLFCDAMSCASAPTSAGDYSLQSTSPCLPAVHSCGSGALIGALPQGCSGPVPTEVTTWGRLKLRFR